jgi:hypothetical protein
VNQANKRSPSVPIRDDELAGVYLQKLQHAVLSREEELEVARGIEREEREILEALVGTEQGKRALDEIFDAVREGRLPLEDVLRRLSSS